MDIIWVKIFAFLFLVALLVKRSILGPQKVFARSAAFFLSSGAILLMASGEVGDASSSVGGILLPIGFLFSGWMLVSEMKWLVTKHITRSHPNR